VVTVDEILANPSRYHKQNCADPLEPDYGDDSRLARIYTLDQHSGAVIHSHAHGGVNYMLRASAAADFANAEQVSPTFRDELEEIASLLGEVDRPLASAMRATTSGQELWALHDRLITAAAIPHPQRSLFDEVVLRAAKTLQSYVADVAQFARLLGAQLASDRQWAQLSNERRRVLGHAARVLLAPIDVLAGFDARTPKLVSRTAEPISYIAEPLLPDESVVALVGPPGSGKSTVATTVAAAVATPPCDDAINGDMNQFGSRSVAHGTVLAFLSEDTRSRVAGLSKWESVHGVAPHIHLIDGTPQLSSISASLAFVQQSWLLVRNPAAPPLKLIIIDLFRDSFSGDENSSKDVGAALTTVRIISRMFSCTVLIVHHSAIGDERRPRGSSAFSGSLDVCAATTMRDGMITLTVTKNRAGEIGQTFRWHFDQDGVLREGSAPHAAGSVNEECALTVARVVWQVADEKTPITRQDLASALAEERSDLFGEAVNENTVKTRRQRAIKAACASGWVANRQNRLIPGKEAPPNDLASTPVGVAELLR
jgi:energy-coupling factor transporter ATP-binding protein EcfA2